MGSYGSGAGADSARVEILRSLLSGVDGGVLAAAFEASSSIVVITDTQGNIEYVNREFTATTGYTAAEVLGQNVRLLRAGQLSRDYYRRMWCAITEGREWHGEFLNRRKNGEQYWERAWIVPLKEPGGGFRHFLSIKEDVTAQKLRETTLRETDKMRVVGALAGGLAHSYNNLLTVIVGYADLLSATLEGSAQEQAREILAAASRAAELTNDLLSFSGRQIVRPRLVYPNRLVTGLRRRLGKTLGDQIRLEVVLEPRLPPVRIDPDQLAQAVLRLAENAHDAMTAGGVLTISTGTVARLEPEAGEVARVGPWAEIRISDTGGGMDEETRRRLFEPFFTTRGFSLLRGMGLSTVLGIMRQAGGAVRVASEPGQGSTFRLCLPLERPLGNKLAK